MQLDVPATEHADLVRRLRARIDADLRALAPHPTPASLYDPVRYVLAGGGKRLRPTLLLLAAEAYGAGAEQAMPAALAVEVFHNFTLVHDDIMDQAPERRGRPTVHRRWGESAAILSGDYMMALAYEQLATVQTPRLGLLLQIFNAMVTRLCEGQALDTEFETRHDVSVADYLAMIDGKTAALLEASLELGGAIGSADAGERSRLRRIGCHLGRAFQIQDDLLDLVADDARWGKSIGGDLIAGKKSYLLLCTLERARGAEHAWFARILHDGGLPEDEVPEARKRMEALGVVRETREAVRAHTTAASDELRHLPPTPAREALRWLMQQMQARVH